MKIDLTVKNLGKLKEGSFKIRPMTILTGPNGTGKSFLTKSLYSILNVINTNAYHLELTKSIAKSKRLLNAIIGRLSYAGQYDHNIISQLEMELDVLQDELNQATELELGAYIDYSKSRVEKIDSITSIFEKYLKSLSQKKQKYSSVKTYSSNFKKSLTSLRLNLENGSVKYSRSLTDNLSNEIKDNFQVTDLSQLISFNEKKTEISMDGLATIEFSKKGIGFSLKHDFINKISSLSRVVFFESPAYWKVRDALISAKEKASFPYFLRSRAKNTLTGVPKYFYDLDDAIKKQVKNKKLSEIEELMLKIEDELGGEFVFSGDEIIFRDHISGKEISKNLISFGMTNLGMIHALLKNNVITPGSFVFIDEPETNLHPVWQVLLMNVLVELAKKDINIVIATHSIEMLKALEVSIKKLDQDSFDDNFMSMHYFDTNNKLMDFESNNPVKQLLEARNELSSSYESLYLEGLN